MDQDRPARWRVAIARVLAPIVALALGLIFLLVLYSLYTGTSLQGWLTLLFVLAVIAGVGIRFNRAHRRREINIEEQWRRHEERAAEQRGQDEALQAYVEQMSKMLTDEDQPLHEAQLGDRLSAVARERTLTALTRVDSSRKRRVLQFLYESGLINEKGTVLSLAESDLKLANLQGVCLQGASLHGANLALASLQGANLQSANLQGANLTFAKLQGANLQGTDLAFAKLQRAKLHGANLIDATNLTTQGINEAQGDENTQLPEHLERPKHWLAPDR